MKKLILLVILGIAIWQAKLHYGDLLHREPSHEAVVKNESGILMERIRVIVGGQTLVKEELPSGESATLPFRIAHDASFALNWQWGNNDERTWSGGRVIHGPMVQRHIMTVGKSGGVVYTEEDIPAK
jgi:hypothetical protein